MHIRNSSDLLTAILFLALGFAALIYSLDHYAVGTIVRPGAGFFPTLVSVGLIGLGLILLAKSLTLPDEPIGQVDPRAVILVLVSTTAFGLLIDQVGLVLAASALVIPARLADRDFHVVETLVLAACLIAITGGIFWWGLGLPIHLWPE